MATAKELSDTARIRAMSAYRDWLEGGMSPAELRAKYSVGRERMRQLIQKGRRLSTPTRHWSYGTLTSKEARDMQPMREFLEGVANGDC